MKTVVHYMNGRRAGRSEQVRTAVRMAIGAGLRVGITFGNGVLMVPPGYGFEWACGGKVGLRAPDGSLVVYSPRWPRAERPARTWVRSEQLGRNDVPWPSP